MMKKIMGMMCVGMVMAVGAVPTISNVTVTQGGNRKVKVSYTLSEKAFVEAEFFQNGVSMGDAVLRMGLAGDIFRPVAAGNQAFTWDVLVALPAETRYENLTVRLTPRALAAAPEWMVVDLGANGETHYYPRESLLIGGTHTDDAYKTTHLLLRRVTAAGIPWRMGGVTTDSHKGIRGGSPHLVTFTEDFYVGVYEVTTGQYKKYNPSASFKWAGDTLPATDISFENLRGSTANYDWPKNGHAVAADSFLGFVRARGANYVDLPTDAQWEYACRGGSSLQLPGKNYSRDALEAMAWFQWNSSNETECVLHPVGLKEANGFGLYDVLGNAVEFCLDWCQTTLATDNIIDPTGPTALSISSGNVGATIYKNGVDGDTETVGRVIRGGAYSWDAGYTSPIYRNWFYANQGDRRGGFRVVAPGTIE